MRAIPAAAVALVQSQESVRLTVYQDVAGVWTIGYGHTGSNITANTAPITQAQAVEFLNMDLQEAAERLGARVTPAVLLKLNDNQYSALLDFVFNAGAGPWQIWRVLNAGLFAQVPAQLKRFVYASEAAPGRADGLTGSKTIEVQVDDLVRRRNAEVALWNTP